ncbi:MAG: CotY/CotZ family spore coat protein [Bacilli bacterium]|jgi:hypothetical protein
MCKKTEESNCIADILKVILILQKKACLTSDELNTCDKKVLGYDNLNICNYNTRPIQLFLISKNGNEPLIMPTTRGLIDETTIYSSVFRLEKLDNNCATFRVLSPISTSNQSTCSSYEKTNSFFTLDLKCVCAIRCLNDTIIEGVC